MMNYLDRSAKFQQTLGKVATKLNFITAARLLLFLAAVAGVFYLIKGNYPPRLLVFFILSSIALFLFLVKLHNSVRFRRDFLQELVKINEQEHQVTLGKFDGFPEGQQFLAIDHPYAYDLDIFGQGSIFQYINRACTWMGQNQLANFLSVGELEPAKILERQKAVQELAPLLDWRHEFMATGRLSDVDQKNWSVLESWLAKPTLLLQLKILHILIWILPLASVSCLIAYLLGFFTAHPMLLFAIAGLLITAALVGKINQIHAQVSKCYPLLQQYAVLLKRLEDKSFSASLLQEIKQSIQSDQLTASNSIEQLVALVNKLDNRLNILVALFLNAFLLWDIRTVLALEKWKQQHADKLEKWLEALGRMDALQCLANLSYNRADFTYPTPNAAGFRFESEGLGHPLLDPQKRVDNDFKVNGWGKMAIVTGANMAGKSTFLRAVGVNFVLAMAGAPVCAKHLEFSPLSLQTSMRTTDSLMEDESYFFAELKRLKGIVDMVESGKPAFIILDEMLRGTNSVDKSKGSEALVRRLSNMKCAALVATHDLSLGILREEIPDKVSLHCFEVEIVKDQLNFDYCIREGLSQTLNATFLMKKMNIIA